MSLVNLVLGTINKINVHVLRRVIVNYCSLFRDYCFSSWCRKWSRFGE